MNTLTALKYDIETAPSKSLHSSSICQTSKPDSRDWRLANCGTIVAGKGACSGPWMSLGYVNAEV